jgi:hypothetical protein
MQAINSPRPGTLRLRPPLRRTLTIAGIARKNDVSTPSSPIDPIATLKDRWTGNVLGMLAAASLVGSVHNVAFKKKDRWDTLSAWDSNSLLYFSCCPMTNRTVEFMLESLVLKFKFKLQMANYNDLIAIPSMSSASRYFRPPIPILHSQQNLKTLPWQPRLRGRRQSYKAYWLHEERRCLI